MSGSGSVPVPLLTHLRLDILPGSLVTVETKNDGTLIGKVFQNPSSVTTIISGNQISSSLQLIDVTRKETGEVVGWAVTLFEKDIVKVTVVEGGQRRPDKQEIFMETHVISTADDLNEFLELITEDIKEIGCLLDFEWDSKSETKRLTWLIFCVKSVIISINVREINKEITLEQGKETKSHWTSLEAKIFSNERVQKVFDDCQKAAEYLYCTHGIPLKNVFDIRLAEKFLLRKEKGTVEQAEYNPSLANLLSKYLCRMVHPPELLKLQVGGDLTLQSEASKCTQTILKIFAIKIKYLLKLKAAMEGQMLKPLEDLLTFRTEFITSASNAVAHGFLSQPCHIGNYFREKLEAVSDPNIT